MNSYTEIEKVNKRLIGLFKLEDSFVVALNGKWGVGKTYFWHNFVNDNLAKETNDKKVAYVSLFGKDSLSDIESDIIMQVSRSAKIKKIIDESIGSVGFYGMKVSNILSVIPKDDFKNIIICFDDFERKSKHIESGDLLGLMSKFKEEKNCKIIIIYNQLKIENKEVFSEYKDKIIDYELNFNPTVAEAFDVVSSKSKVFTKYILEYLLKKGINNIRIIKRIINALNDFEFIVDEVRNELNIEEELASSIIMLAVVNASYSNFDLNSLVEYAGKKRLEKEHKVNLKYENILFLLDIENPYFYPSDILKNINRYFENSIIDEENLLSIVNQNKLLGNQNKLLGKIHGIYSGYNYDLSSNEFDFSNKMYAALKEGKENIVKIIGLENFIFYIRELIKIENKPEYKEFAINNLKKYIDIMYQEDDTIKEFNFHGGKNKVIEFDLSLSKYIDKKNKKNTLNKTKTKKEVIELFKAPRRNSGWGDEPKLLESIDKKKYMQYIEEDSNFLKEAISFIQWNQGINNKTGFENAIKNIVEALLELEKNPDYEFKISKIINYFDLKKYV